MPTLAVKGVEAVLVLVFGFSIFGWILPGPNRDRFEVDIRAYQNEVYYGFIDFGGERSYLEIREVDGSGDAAKGTGKVKISFRRKGQDVSLIYERGQEVTDADIMVIEKVLDEINKKPSWLQSGIADTLKGLLNRPSKSKKRGAVGKFLP